MALPLRSRGSGGRERAKGLQTAVVAHPARAMPPSPEVMPHGTIGDAVANLLALRCAPRSGAQGHRRRPRTQGRPSGCSRGAPGAFDAAITRGDATRYVWRSRRQPARASLRSALVCAHEGGAQRSLSVGCRRSQDVSCGTTSCAAGGSGGRERAVCSQTAGVAHPARAMPPSPEAMPHNTFGEVVANLLALRARAYGAHRRGLAAAGCSASRRNRDRASSSPQLTKHAVRARVIAT